MAFNVKGKRQQQKVLFKKRAMSDRNPSSNPPPAPTSSSPSDGSERQLYSDRQSSAFISPPFPQNTEAAERVLNWYGPAHMSAATVSRATLIPDLFTTLPLVRDRLETESSEIQDETIQECLPFLNGLQTGVKFNNHGVPHLDRKRHVQFAHKTLRPLPAAFVAADASRPWMFYWSLASLATMGEDISIYREKVIATVRPIQNLGGGFGGGHGQMSHLAPTYAIILSLAMVGGSDAWDLVDRKAMWKWLSALKQPDGGFQMSIGGEEDIRGAYCAAVIMSLLDLPLDLSKESPAYSWQCTTLVAGLPEWIARCQTFEGGISGPPGAEAHGAYAFCALACLCILGDPHTIIPEFLDVPRLISWLSARQYAPEGGFAGRTNKLVDGCYSHWVGGCWPLIEACLDGPSSVSAPSWVPQAPQSAVGSLYSREGLIRYILCCCQDQSKRGGLRDKPSHNSDGYHTCYVLAGLSSAQYKWHFSASTKTETLGTLISPYQWTSEPFPTDMKIYDEEDKVNTLHPVFVIPEGAAEEMRAYFTAKGGF